jgi:hypothetical protein
VTRPVAELAGSAGVDVPEPGAPRFSIKPGQEALALWLTGDETAARALFRPWPDGRLTISEAKNVDWAQP